MIKVTSGGVVAYDSSDKLSGRLGQVRYFRNGSVEYGWRPALVWADDSGVRADLFDGLVLFLSDVSLDGEIGTVKVFSFSLQKVGHIGASLLFYLCPPDEHSNWLESLKSELNASS